MLIREERLTVRRVEIKPASLTDLITVVAVTITAVFRADLHHQIAPQYHRNQAVADLAPVQDHLAVRSVVAEDLLAVVAVMAAAEDLHWVGETMAAAVLVAGQEEDNAFFIINQFKSPPDKFRGTFLFH